MFRILFVVLALCAMSIPTFGLDYSQTVKVGAKAPTVLEINQTTYSFRHHSDLGWEIVEERPGVTNHKATWTDGQLTTEMEVTFGSGGFVAKSDGTVTAKGEPHSFRFVSADTSQGD